VTHDPQSTQPKSAYSNFNRICTSEDWFEVYEIAPQLYVFHEPRHYEGTIVNLVIGEHKAVLIDTGCGIGNLRAAVEAITDKPVTVINTHSHPDHLGGNRQFDEIVMFDRSLSHQVSEKGIDHRILEKEILAENLVTKPWPIGFDRGSFSIPPFHVSRWLQDGERLTVGGRTWR
jgi:glyoxylase-like metal-dependent hydrolase (beta-lactamase superfamily II)